MTDAPRLEKAQLIPMNGGEPDVEAAITVQFNPESLKVGLSNTLQAENEGGGQSSAAQYISKSESTLSLTLVFDSSVETPRSQAERDEALDAAAEEFLTTDKSFSEFEEGLRRDSEHQAEMLDVRTRTKAIADLFMQPQAAQGGQGSGEQHPAPPKQCRFQWGAFAFVGMMASYDETLDFFSPEGLPLRAMLALTFKADRYQFEQKARPEPAVREQPRFAPGGGSVPEAARNAGRNPRDWRDMALFNGIESPRLAASLSLGAPGVSLSGSASLGGAAIAAGGISGGISGGASFSAGFGAGGSAGISGGGFPAGLSSGLSGGFGGAAGISAAAGGSLSASGPSLTLSTSAPARASFSVGASSALGTDVPGAFIAMGGAGATAHAQAAFRLDARARAGASAGAFGGANASASAGAFGGAFGGAGLSASAGASAAARASADFDFDTA